MLQINLRIIINVDMYSCTPSIIDTRGNYTLDCALIITCRQMETSHATQT